MVRKKEPRTHQRTIRMTERVEIILNTYEGKSMNDQFENLVLDSNEKLPFALKDLEEVERRKDALLQEINELKNIRNDLKTISRSLDQANRMAAKIDRDTKKVLGKKTT